MPTLATTRLRVRVPASSANLGPGFDAFGLALALYDVVVVRATAEGLTVDITGEGDDILPRSEHHLVVRAARAAFDRMRRPAPGLEVVCTNRIPQGRGLGSSAAAICAGVLAARALVPDGDVLLDDDATFALAVELEGHPDNVAACLYGGFTIAWASGNRPRWVSLVPTDDVLPVLFVPDDRLSTTKARVLLPPTVPHADAARTAGRSALFVEALTRRPDLLLDATDDWLHQPYRAAAIPASAHLVATLRSDGVPAVLSGAGPAVLAFCDTASASGVAAMAPKPWSAHPVEIDRSGAVVSSSPPEPWPE